MTPIPLCATFLEEEHFAFPDSSGTSLSRLSPSFPPGVADRDQRGTLTDGSADSRARKRPTLSDSWHSHAPVIIPQSQANTEADYALKFRLLDDTLSLVDLDKKLTGNEEQVCTPLMDGYEYLPMYM